MSVREVVMYRVVCDWPGCEASPQDDTEQYAWTEAAHALDDVEYAGWWTGRDDDQLHWTLTFAETMRTPSQPLLAIRNISDPAFAVPLPQSRD